MKRLLKLKNLGPIKDCEIAVDDFTVLTGPQASGKSTIARAIYFFRTLKEDIFDQVTHQPSEDEYENNIHRSVEKKLRSKFLRIFGSTWSMSKDMSMEYFYAPHVKIRAFLEPNRNYSYRNFVSFELDEKIRDFLCRYENHEYIWEQDKARQELRREIDELFQDEYETVYIPAGRSLITVLTDRLAGIMDADDRTLDYCMRSYIRLTLNKRAEFKEGVSGLLDEKLHMTQAKIDHDKLDLLLSIMDRVLQGRYSYQMGEERLNLKNHKYVKINFASSGQQEVVWVFNLLYYYLLERSRIFLIIEEPEAHLYPDAQKAITEALGLFGHERNQVFMTTHSPYILGELNNLLFANTIPEAWSDRLPMPKLELLPGLHTSVKHVKDGYVKEGIQDGFIQNELIDGASDEINDEMQELMELSVKWDENE
ncbi:MAG: ATP-binding protein [Schwartzia succinivorans]|jgi:predicted ATP-dependent endonuclease of OLD family|uniref:AAA family ATPase n=1 Tax=Schwartzia succinivorans TaxID=55507 RepID=UPI0023538737|nr:AAA family ATPase [Schwartzia succinivorans]MBE6096661.1 ATP-binding protein [Schwartzia succinivorans]